ncbi:MAG: type pilus assembly protein PilB [Acidimicrobiaceae bacterium]|nr:type pilus assembly protein PilB [Acidimicrobiaceae bacterium]
MAFKRKTEKSPWPGRGDESEAEATSVSTLVGEAHGEEHGRQTPDSTDGTNSREFVGATTSSMNVRGPYKGRLGDLLIEKGLVTPEQLDLVLAEQKENGGKLGEILVTMHLLDPHVLADALGTYFGLVVVDLRRENVDSAVIALVPEAMAREQLAIPVRSEDDGLYIAVAEPSDELRALLAKTTGRAVHMMIAPMSDITWALDTNYRAIGSVGKLVQAFEAVEGARKRTANTQEVDVTNDDAPVVQVVDRILTQAMRDRASDVHIEPSEDYVRVRFRIDGALKEILKLPVAIGPGLVSRIKIMANMNIVERRRPQDGQLTINIDGSEVDVRVATVSTIMGENCVMRILDKTRSVFKLNDLGMPRDTHSTYSKVVRSPFGMVLCAGPTGSGKTTTLYATLSEVSNPTLNVMTIEDPVEYVFPSINQIQTNEQAGLNFATGLKSILRQDPDVILVGEIRDVETTRVAVQSALTGHFVISSMHATDSVSALHRFLDMGIESFLVASAVLAIVGQRLLRRICPSCKTTYELSDDEREFYEESGGPPKATFYYGSGCNFCSDTGYKDRIGVYELLIMTPEIKRLIVGWATQEELHNMAMKQGMRTLRQEAISLVAQDITTVAEVIRSVYAL